MTDNMNKALADALAYGTGVLLDNKHVSLENVYLDPRDAIIVIEPQDYDDYACLIEEQAGEIVGLKAQLHMALDREADTQCRHDAKVEAQAAEIVKLRGAVAALLQHEASSFFGPDDGKHKRASWRGVIRKARAAMGETK